MVTDTTVSFSSLLTRESLIPTGFLGELRGTSDLDLFILCKKRFQISEDKLLELVSTHYLYPILDLSEIVFQPGIIQEWPVSQLKSERFLPLFHDDYGIGIILDNPFSDVVKQLEVKFSCLVHVYLVSSFALDEYLFDLEQNIGDGQFFQSILQQAVDEQASDIHVNQLDHGVRISFRVQGRLLPYSTLTKGRSEILASLIKFHSHMDPSGFSQPQDGRLSFSYKNRTIDCRVSSIPTTYGEDFVIRLFPFDYSQFKLERLGFSVKPLKLISQSLNDSSGLILITGATGSGKTTTLYSCLAEIYKQRQGNMVSLEDPIEAILPFVRQSQIQPRIGYDFAQGMKALLRQDPDVIMIGEIRDRETAQIALEAAYSGHLVLSTLHTGDVSSSLLRLFSFDCDPFLVSQCLKGIISQQLLPKRCQSCGAKSKHEEQHGLGCLRCQYTGFEGRLLLSEVLRISKTFYSSHVQTLCEQLISQNQYWSFNSDAHYKLERGLCSYYDVQNFISEQGDLS